MTRSGQSPRTSGKTLLYDFSPLETTNDMRPKKIILCVDDNEQALSVRKFLLETKGYRVLTATSGHEALEIVDKYASGELSLLLCDLIMPGMDGVELIRRVRDVQPGLPTLMVSGTVTSFERGVGADIFLPKGASSPAELLERVRVLVARKRGPKKGSHRMPLPQIAAAQHQAAA